MIENTPVPIYLDDTRACRIAETFLQTNGLRLDKTLDYLCGIYDESGCLIAVGGYSGNTLRCMAVSSEHQGEGLLNIIVTHLLQEEIRKGNHHIFLYTKNSAKGFFMSLGFYPISEIPGHLIFMENRRNGFSNYLDRLKEETALFLEKCSDADTSIKNTLPAQKTTPNIAALVMNANPFTLGHRFLAETASRESALVHLFILSEDASHIPFSVRRKLVLDGVSDLPNIVCHDSGPYIISRGTFPSYFQKDETAVVESHAMLDAFIFTNIAATLGITCRYVGEEPKSLVTSIYNQILANVLPEHGIACRILPRKTTDSGEVISASSVRQNIHDGRWDLVKDMLPAHCYDYFRSTEATALVNQLRDTEKLIHH